MLPQCARFLLFTALLLAPVALGRDSTQPTPRLVEYEWMPLDEWYRRHADDIEVARAGQAEILFLGDSITQGWEHSSSYKRRFSQYDPANFGVGGDRTENLLWRLQHGAVGNLDPKAIVLLIGVNNFGQRNDSPEAVFEGVKANVELLKASFPKANILVLGILPWGENPDDPNRLRAKAANELLESLEAERVRIADVGSRFLEADGSISKDVMADFLHPTDEGYQRLTDAVLPILTPWLQ